jgi:hypothetical protein
MKSKLSPRFSMKGYHLLTWLSRNKENLKLLLAGIALIVAPYGLAGKAIVAGASKLLLDGLDYFASEVKLKE